MADERKRYLSFLMRLWQARDHDRVVWRVSLEDAHSGTRHAFADLRSMFVFLQAQRAGTIQLEQLEVTDALSTMSEEATE